MSDVAVGGRGFCPPSTFPRLSVHQRLKVHKKNDTLVHFDLRPRQGPVSIQDVLKVNVGICAWTCSLERLSYGQLN